MSRKLRIGQVLTQLERMLNFGVQLQNLPDC